MSATPAFDALTAFAENYRLDDPANPLSLFYALTIDREKENAFVGLVPPGGFLETGLIGAALVEYANNPRAIVEAIER